MSSSTKVVTGSITGMIVGLLVMKGVIAPQDASAFTQNLDVLSGAIIAIVSVIGFFEHHIKNPDKTTSIQKTDSGVTVSTTETTTPPQQ